VVTNALSVMVPPGALGQGIRLELHLVESPAALPLDQLRAPCGFMPAENGGGRCAIATGVEAVPTLVTAPRGFLPPSLGV
jgi:hypothetical protein